VRRAVFLYNPRSGGRRRHRMAEIEAAMQAARAAGYETTASETRSAKDAAEQARAAVASGCDAIFACGGDGTVHDLLQGMAHSQVPLAIIPQGTANALAHDLGIPRDPARAARAALNGTPRRIALGRLTCTGFDGAPVARYFTVAAGIGADAALFHQLGSEFKSRFGMAAYVAKALHLWLTMKMPFFEVETAVEIKNEAKNETTSAAPGNPRTAQVTELLAVRISDFGNVLRRLAPGAALDREQLRLVQFQTSSRLRYLAYVLRGLFGLRCQVPRIELSDATRVICRPLSVAMATGNEAAPAQVFVYVEADGELLGTLPAEITIEPDALTLLAPSIRQFDNAFTSAI
jgi:diacylglycerol kinase (ATP)